MPFQTFQCDDGTDIEVEYDYDDGFAWIEKSYTTGGDDVKLTAPEINRMETWLNEHRFDDPSED